jgi:hypothetical protein
MTAVRLRIQRIRRIVTACAVAVFIALFSTIYVQMASGNDPELATNTAKASASTSTTDSRTSADTSTTATDNQPAAVTTGQS